MTETNKMNPAQRIIAKVLVPAKPEENCSGCRICEVECAMFHEHVCNPKKARIRVVSLENGIDYPIVCAQCEKAECLEVCPEGAILRDEMGTIILVDEKCTSCGSCFEACSRGAIFPHPETGKPLMCDLCNGDPQCVRLCPPKILAAIPRTAKKELPSKRRADWVRKSVMPRFAREWGLQ